MSQELTEKANYPEYERDALFRCDQGCGTVRRERAHTFRGRLVCPACRLVGTLRFTGRAMLSASPIGEQ